jgi:hypothetical protein
MASGQRALVVTLTIPYWDEAEYIEDENRLKQIRDAMTGAVADLIELEFGEKFATDEVESTIVNV